MESTKFVLLLVNRDTPYRLDVFVRLLEPFRLGIVLVTKMLVYFITSGF